jgi:hypothetical protein
MKETTTSRELLDCLGRKTLVRLIYERGLLPSRENDERRKTLAHSYRGDVEALINDLNRQELITVFRSLVFVVNREVVELPNPGQYRLDELRAFAIRGFVGRRVRIAGEFSPALDPDDEDSDDEADPEDDDDSEGDDEDVENAGDDGDTEGEDDEADRDVEEAADEDEARATAFEDITHDWSRPRVISRIFRMLGSGVPQRLRTARFADLLVELRDLGIEACFADDPSAEPLQPGAESPGVHAKLRLRRPACPACRSGDVVQILWGEPSPEAAEMAEAGRIALGGCVVTGDDPVWRCKACGRDFGGGSLEPGEGARRSPAHARSRTGGPAIVVQPGERPVSQKVPRPSDYNVAVLRLQFLTAVPSVERRSMPEWPAAYLEAASRGLQLRPQEASLLRAYAIGLTIGNHSPYDAIPHLSSVLAAGEWEQLLDDFVRLNPFQPELVRAIVAQVEPITAPKSEAQTWRNAVPPPEDFREPDRPTVRDSTEPLAASSRRASVTPAEPEVQGANRRDLGPPRRG